MTLVSFSGNLEHHQPRGDEWQQEYVERVTSVNVQRCLSRKETVKFEGIALMLEPEPCPGPACMVGCNMLS